MEKLGRDLLYHDIDFIIYASNGCNDSPLGKFLGEFTDELEGDVITTFVSGGPKNYAYQTASGKTCCKVRGFSLNFRSSQLLILKPSDVWTAVLTNMKIFLSTTSPKSHGKPKRERCRISLRGKCTKLCLKKEWSRKISPHCHLVLENDFCKII